MADRGSPDTVNCIKGHFVGIEYKKDEAEVRAWWREAEKVSLGYKADERVEAQYHQKKMIEEAGGTYLVSFSIEETERLLKLKGLL